MMMMMMLSAEMQTLYYLNRTSAAGAANQLHRRILSAEKYMDV